MVKRAVLVGVNKYRDPDVNDLRGCVNDVESISSLLVDEYGFASGNIRKLVRDPDNTRNGILTALKELVAATGEDDVVVVYYSGHGSQVPDESDDAGEEGWDETIVPSDSGRSGRPVLDIVDDELHSHLTALAEKTENCTFVFDSCHSGTVDRFLLQQGSEITSPAVTIRATVPADSPPAEQPDIHPAGRAPGTAIAVGNRATGAQRYLKVAACLDEQTAGERRFDDAVGGIFTHHLVAALRADSTQPFEAAFETVRRKLRSEGQNPVFDGPGKAKRAAPFGGGAKATPDGGEEELDPDESQPDAPDPKPEPQPDEPEPEPDPEKEEDDGEGGDKAKLQLLEWDPKFAGWTGFALFAALLLLGGALFCTTHDVLGDEDAAVRFSGIFGITIVLSGLLLALAGAYAALLGQRGRARKAATTVTVSEDDGQTAKRTLLSDKAVEAVQKTVEALGKMPNARVLIVVGALVLGGGVAFVWNAFPPADTEEEAPEIVRQPQAVSGKVGGKAFFRVVATGENDDLTYAWTRNGKTIPKAKGEALFVKSLTAGMDGDTITAIVSDGSGGKTVSDDVKLTVKK